MQGQYYSVLLSNAARGYFIMVAAGLSPHAALAEVIEYLDEDSDAVTLGVFAGLLLPQTTGVALSKDTTLLFTPSAAEMDQRRASLHMLDDWTKCTEHLYVASISPPEELEDEISPETLTIELDRGRWWVSSSDSIGQTDYRFLEEAVIAANDTIAAIRAGFLASDTAAA